ncbi:cytochrome b5-like heme/steroid binding domain-containing protein, partial [Fomitopsis betulina]
WSYSSCWIIIEKKVYDVTDFVPQHPGGPRMILNFAGRDATHAFKSLHSLDVLAARLPPHKHLGNLA